MSIRFVALCLTLAAGVMYLMSSHSDYFEGMHNVTPGTASVSQKWDVAPVHEPQIIVDGSQDSQLLTSGKLATVDKEAPYHKEPFSMVDGVTKSILDEKLNERKDQQDDTVMEGDLTAEDQIKQQEAITFIETSIDTAMVYGTWARKDSLNVLARFHYLTEEQRIALRKKFYSAVMDRIIQVDNNFIAF